MPNAWPKSENSLCSVKLCYLHNKYSLYVFLKNFYNVRDKLFWTITLKFGKLLFQVIVHCWTTTQFSKSIVLNYIAAIKLSFTEYFIVVLILMRETRPMMFCALIMKHPVQWRFETLTKNINEIIQRLR